MGKEKKGVSEERSAVHTHLEGGGGERGSTMEEGYQLQSTKKKENCAIYIVA